MQNFTTSQGSPYSLCSEQDAQGAAQFVDIRGDPRCVFTHQRTYQTHKKPLHLPCELNSTALQETPPGSHGVSLPMERRRILSARRRHAPALDLSSSLVGSTTAHEPKCSISSREDAGSVAMHASGVSKSLNLVPPWLPPGAWSLDSSASASSPPSCAASPCTSGSYPSGQGKHSADGASTGGGGEVRSEASLLGHRRHPRVFCFQPNWYHLVDSALRGGCCCCPPSVDSCSS